MGNRRLYGSREFLVKTLEKHEKIWHLFGVFPEGVIRSKYTENEYRIRVKPDPRWENISQISFIDNRIYECESIASVSRKHVYGSGKWYISRYFDGPRLMSPSEGELAFKDFLVVVG
ncbi:MAG: hypothetical protein HYT37_03920 [Candidatus Sungbacteria bacterium]|nr:hypothetical protein [Candidatus Sungbacteria bacterium]